MFPTCRGPSPSEPAAVVLRPMRRQASTYKRASATVCCCLTAKLRPKSMGSSLSRL